MAKYNFFLRLITGKRDVTPPDNNGENNSKQAKVQNPSPEQNNVFAKYWNKSPQSSANEYILKKGPFNSNSTSLKAFGQSVFNNDNFQHGVSKSSAANKSMFKYDYGNFNSYYEARLEKYYNSVALFACGNTIAMPIAKVTLDTYKQNSNKPTPQKTDITKAGEYGEKHKINEITLPDGTVVVAHNYSNFNQCQEQWLDLQKYMVQAANELGLTLVYSDVCRTVSTSNKSRADKGNHVAAGGSSPHNYGVAADIILLKDGKRIDEKSNLQKQFAEKVSELSEGKIAWGGDKKYYPKLYKKERHHFELRDWNKKDSENYCKNRGNLINRLV